MIAIPVGIIWFGYLVAWYGEVLLKGKPIGFVDLMLPNRLAKVEAALKGDGPTDFNIPNPNFGGGDFGSPNPPPQGGGPPLGHI